MIRFQRLTPTFVEQDHAALMRDVDALRAWSAQDWPTVDFTVDDNLVDLIRHDQEHLDAIALTFSVILGADIVGCIYVHRFEHGLRTRDIVPPADPRHHRDTIVRGWAHDIAADTLIQASRDEHGDPFESGGRWWWQTNTDCPDQLAACDRSGLSDELSFETPAATWVLRSVPE